MSKVIELAALQELDNEAAFLRAALADTEHRLAGDDDLDDARRRLAQGESIRAAIAADQRTIEEEVERLSQKIVPEEKRLYDGSVHSPKELTSIQRELELLKAARARHEDALVEVLDRADAAEREGSETQAEVGRLEARWKKLRGELQSEARRLAQALADADLRRQSQAAKMPPRLVQLYEDLRRRKAGVAVSKIQSGTCMGCRIGIPDAVRTRALAGSALAQCPNCERILYVG